MEPVRVERLAHRAGLGSTNASSASGASGVSAGSSDERGFAGRQSSRMRWNEHRRSDHHNHHRRPSRERLRDERRRADRDRDLSRRPSNAAHDEEMVAAMRNAVLQEREPERGTVYSQDVQSSSGLSSTSSFHAQSSPAPPPSRYPFNNLMITPMREDSHNLAAGIESRLLALDTPSSASSSADSANRHSFFQPAGSASPQHSAFASSVSSSSRQSSLHPSSDPSSRGGSLPPGHGPSSSMSSISSTDNAASAGIDSPPENLPHRTATTPSVAGSRSTGSVVSEESAGQSLHTTSTRASGSFSSTKAEAGSSGSPVYQSIAAQSRSKRNVPVTSPGARPGPQSLDHIVPQAQPQPHFNIFNRHTMMSITLPRGGRRTSSSSGSGGKFGESSTSLGSGSGSNNTATTGAAVWETALDEVAEHVVGESPRASSRRTGNTARSRSSKSPEAMEVDSRDSREGSPMEGVEGIPGAVRMLAFELF